MADWNVTTLVNGVETHSVIVASDLHSATTKALLSNNPVLQVSLAPVQDPLVTQGIEALVTLGLTEEQATAIAGVPTP